MTTFDNLAQVLYQRRRGRRIREVAKEIGISHSTLLRAEQGLHSNVSTYRKIHTWLGEDVAVSAAPAPTPNDAPAIAQVHLGEPVTVSAETAHALARMILAAQAMLAQNPR